MTGPRAARDRQRVELFYPTIDSTPLETRCNYSSVGPWYLYRGMELIIPEVTSSNYDNLDGT